MSRARNLASLINSGFNNKTTVGSSGAVSLDLGGDNNFFDAGTLTADTTVSFTNAPSKKKFTYSFIPGHNSATSSVNDTDTWQPDFSLQHTVAVNSMGATFNSDGTKVVYTDAMGDYLIEVDLAIPYDDSSMVRGRKKVYSLSTTSGTYSNSGTLGSSNLTGPRNATFSSDGTRIILLNSSTDQLFQFNLSTAYDLSSYTSTNYLTVATYETGPSSWCFNNDGTKVFVSGSQGDDINEYNTSAAYNVHNGSFQRSGGSSTYLGTSGLDAMMFGKDGVALFGITATAAANNFIKYDTSANPNSIQSMSAVTSQYLTTAVFGHYSGSSYGMQYIDNDRIRVERGPIDSNGSAIIECGTSYWPTFSGTISGNPNYFSRGYRHFIDFETSNTGTSYGIIDHTKHYVG